MRPTGYEAEVVEFLAQPENLPAALEIAEHVEAVKELLFIQFWQRLKSGIHKDLHQISGWTLHIPPEDKLKASYGGIEMAPAVHTSDLYLRVRIEHRAQKQHFYGVAWSREVKDRGKESKAAAGVEKIQHLLRARDNWKEDNLWVRWRNLAFDLGDKSSLLRVSRDENFPAEISDAFIELFQTVKAGVEEANAQLSE